MLKLLALLIVGLFAAAQPAPPPASAEGVERVGERGVERDIDSILQQLDRTGQALTSLESAVRHTEYDDDTGQEVVRRGRLFLRRNADGTDVRFRVVFNGVEREGGGLIARKKEYVLVGDKLIERDWATKTQITRVLSPEQAERDLLKLGEGPFPLPIGQSPEEVRQQFAVTPVDPADEAQNEFDVKPVEGAERIRLTPLPRTAFADDYEWIELDVDDGGFPRKVTTWEGTNLVISELRDPKLNRAMPDETFELEPIDPAEWNIVVEEMAN